MSGAIRKSSQARNCDGFTFSEWIERVNNHADEMVGMSLDDLPDKNTWDAWNAGEVPLEFLRNVLEEEGYLEEDNE